MCKKNKVLLNLLCLYCVGFVGLLFFIFVILEQTRKIIIVLPCLLFFGIVYLTLIRYLGEK